MPENSASTAACNGTCSASCELGSDAFLTDENRLVYVVLDLRQKFVEVVACYLAHG